MADTAPVTRIVDRRETLQQPVRAGPGQHRVEHPDLPDQDLHRRRLGGRLGTYHRRDGPGGNDRLHAQRSHRSDEDPQKVLVLRGSDALPPGDAPTATTP